MRVENIKVQRIKHHPFNNRFLFNRTNTINKFYDFVFRLGGYPFHEKDRMDLFLSFQTCVGPSHADKEDVFILGLHGKTVYTVFDKELLEITIERGDMVYIPSGIMHRSISITPRIIASLSLWSKSND